MKRANKKRKRLKNVFGLHKRDREKKLEDPNE